MILEKQVLSFAKAVEEITALERLGPDDIEAFRERRMLQMRRVAERRPKWCALGTASMPRSSRKSFSPSAWPASSS